MQTALKPVRTIEHLDEIEIFLFNLEKLDAKSADAAERGGVVPALQDHKAIEIGTPAHPMNWVSPEDCGKPLVGKRGVRSAPLRVKLGGSVCRALSAEAVLPKERRANGSKGRHLDGGSPTLGAERGPMGKRGESGDRSITAHGPKAARR